MQEVVDLFLCEDFLGDDQGPQAIHGKSLAIFLDRGALIGLNLGLHDDLCTLNIVYVAFSLFLLH